MRENRKKNVIALVFQVKLGMTDIVYSILNFGVMWFKYKQKLRINNILLSS